MSNLVEHAKKELQFLRTGDEMNEAMYRHLIHMVNEFAKEGHSGFSAGYAISALEKLLRFEPLRPLTGESHEWVKVGDNLWQNNRCSRVFTDAEGNAYDIDGKVFIDPDGSAYTSEDSHVNITFPYTPHTEFVDVDE